MLRKATFVISLTVSSFVSSFSQIVSTEKGLTTIIFDQSLSKIILYLPDDMQAGELISGRIKIELPGKNARQQAKNLAALNAKTVSVCGKKILISQENVPVQFQLSETELRSGAIELQDAAGNRISSCTLPDQAPQPGKKLPTEKCKMPAHVLCGSPLRLSGTFDGNLATTNCAINGNAMEVLAESPRQCVVQFPQSAKGTGQISATENGKAVCSGEITGVDMVVEAGKLNLLKGEKTYIQVTVTGLSKLADTAYLRLTNATTDVVTMLPANNITEVLLPDSAPNGLFQKRYHITSTRSGSFTVNVDLDLPDDTGGIMYDVPGNYNNNVNSCDCKLDVELVKRTNTNPRATFGAVVKKGCNGPDCKELNFTRSWSVVAGNENAEVVDSRNDKSIITIQTKNAKTFVLKFSASLSCSGGKTCTAVKYCNEKGEEVTAPQSRPENEGVTETPAEKNGKRCSCNASCSITRGKPKDRQVSYVADIKAACTGASGSGSSLVVCSVGPVIYQWKIGDGGKNIAEIIGKNSEKTVTVKELKEGNYTLYLSGTVTCSDGTTCDFVCSWEQSVPPPIPGRACMPSLTHLMGPLLDGGLIGFYRGAKNTKLIRRDDFVALKAGGDDIDFAVPECAPVYECPDAGCNRRVPITGRVSFEWEISAGTGDRGSLVKIGCIPDDKKAIGEHVIFKPPFIPLPVNGKDTTVTTEIELIISDAGSPVNDPQVHKTIFIKTTRSTGNPDFYQVDISGAAYKPPSKPNASSDGCACKPDGPKWSPGNDLIKPDIILPKASTAGNKIVLGQWMVLTTSNQVDKDNASYTCISASSCPVTTIPWQYDDVVIWEWSVKGGGQILFDRLGQNVVYAAPLEFPKGVDSADITITLKVYNPAGRADPEKSSVTEKVIRVYRPGIRLDYPVKSWLPQDTNHVTINTRLVYRSGKGWLPAFDHMCRILYFELTGVSSEKGVCMNEPVPDKADECFDLQLEKKDSLEVFGAPEQVKGKCMLTDQFMQARTVKPVKDFSVDVRSLDFGAYGFLRSFANINRGISVTKNNGQIKVVDNGRDNTSESPAYTSVPWLKEEVQHPLFNGRGKSKEYTDNRVTLPYDADENHIADAGWVTAGDVKVDDPPFVFNTKPTEKELKDAKRKGEDIFPDNDRENVPLGDGFRGDGLGSYEEYRGFRVKIGDETKQVRTNPEVKDIFVCNQGKFSLKLYKEVSGLDVYEITEDQFGGTNLRVVNFNNSPSTHIVDQRGLYLIEGTKGGTLLGIARTVNGKPSIPNYTNDVVIYRNKIAEICAKFRLNADQKLAAVVAHELLHANNVCHHGEGDEAIENSHDVLQGLRSGDIFCVMHYDNSGNKRDIKYIPEPIGSRLCTSDAGTGYNLPSNNTGMNEDGHLYFGEAAEGKGNCAAQIRISGRGDMPSSCGNRYDSKNELKKQFKRKKAK